RQRIYPGSRGPNLCLRARAADRGRLHSYRRSAPHSRTTSVELADVHRHPARRNMRAARNRVADRPGFETCMKGAAMGTSGPSPPEVGGKIPARAFGPFDRKTVERYALASGDDNPLHLDRDVAAAAGLPNTPVHGLLMLSCFEPYILDWRSDLFIT